MKRIKASSGISDLDRLLGGLYVGDNVVWYDDAGSLAAPFCLNFIQRSQIERREVIYVSFDRSPKNLLEKLGALAQSEDLTILDCFTHGKGAGSAVFLKFYEKDAAHAPCRIVPVEAPQDMARFTETFYALVDHRRDDMRFVFESLTGVEELWGGEEQIAAFYAHWCPRLYELDTIAYWVMEKEAHSRRLRARINQIAQVAVTLSVKRGTTYLNILKAENRNTDHLNKAHPYWNNGLDVALKGDKKISRHIDLGTRLKALRKQKGLSQTELARRVGVTSSTISQVENNLIYPSLPALLKMADVLSVELSSLFEGSRKRITRIVFPLGDATETRFPDIPHGSMSAKRLLPVDFDTRAEPYAIEIPPGKTIPHFFTHKGEEMGYLLSGSLHMDLDEEGYTVRAGDVVYLTTQTPSRWENPGPQPARILWIKIS
jgi:transcriptional regulator with XRE-family HTH domain